MIIQLLGQPDVSVRGGWARHQSSNGVTTTGGRPQRPHNHLSLLFRAQCRCCATFLLIRPHSLPYTGLNFLLSSVVFFPCPEENPLQLSGILLLNLLSKIIRSRHPTKCSELPLHQWTQLNNCCPCPSGLP